MRGPCSPSSAAQEKDVRPGDDPGEGLQALDLQRLEVALALAGEEQERAPLEQDAGEDDAVRGADDADAVGGHASPALEDDPVAGRGEAAQVLHGRQRDVVGEQSLRGVVGHQAAIHDQPVLDGERGRGELAGVRPGGEDGDAQDVGPSEVGALRSSREATQRPTSRRAPARCSGRLSPRSTALEVGGAAADRPHAVQQVELVHSEAGRPRPGPVEVLVVAQRAGEARGHVLVGHLRAPLDEGDVGGGDVGSLGELRPGEADLAPLHPDARVQARKPLASHRVVETASSIPAVTVRSILDSRFTGQYTHGGGEGEIG